MSAAVTLILVAGPSGSGKSTFAGDLAEAFAVRGQDSRVIALDNFYRDLSHLSPEARALHNFDQPEAWESERIINVAIGLKSQRAVEIPVYDFEWHVRSSETIRIEPAPIVIMEGLFALCFPALNDLADLRIFVDLDDEIALQRRIVRDQRDRGRTIDSVVQQYRTTVQPANECYIRPSACMADIQLSGDVPCSPQIETLFVRYPDLVR